LNAIYPVGTTTITWNVTDANGNAAATVIQTVNVTDIQKPVISTNGDQNITIPSGQISAILTASATATDNCTVGIPSGIRGDGLLLDAPYPVGTTTITWNVSDINGNAAISVIQKVTVVSINQLPKITTNGNLSVNNDAGMCGAKVTVTATASGINIIGLPKGVRSDGLPVNAIFPVGTTSINWTVSDGYGNTASATQTVTVSDTAKPVFTASPQNIIAIGCNSVTYVVTATDNCTITPTYSYFLSGATTGSGKGTGSGTKFNAGVTNVIITATDAYGNSSQCQFNVTTCTRNLTNYFMLFTNGSGGANWQGASNGYVGNIAIDGIQASETTSGTFPYADAIFTNSGTLNGWQSIISSNSGQAYSSYNQRSLITGLENELENAFTLINSLAVTRGYDGINISSLNGLNTQNGIAETFVINVTSGFQVSSPIKITGDANDLFIFRWDTDKNFSNGYNGQVKFQSGGAIVPLGNLTAVNFINVAGDINSSGGGNTPAAPYPQGPRYNNGLGSLISGGKDFKGGGFFTGYWLTTGAPTIFTPGQQPYGQTSPQSKAIFVGGWYTKSTKFSLTSGSSGVYVGGCALLNTPVSISTPVDNYLIKNEINSKLAVKVSPNPTSNYFNFTIGSASNDKVHISVADNVGRIMEMRTVSPNSNLQLGEKYHPGSYFIEFIQGTQRVVLKLIKEGN
jgi:hypothetical protein